MRLVAAACVDLRRHELIELGDQQAEVRVELDAVGGEVPDVCLQAEGLPRGGIVREEYERRWVVRVDLERGLDLLILAAVVEDRARIKPAIVGRLGLHADLETPH